MRLLNIMLEYRPFIGLLFVHPLPEHLPHQVHEKDKRLKELLILPFETHDPQQSRLPGTVRRLDEERQEEARHNFRTQ